MPVQPNDIIVIRDFQTLFQQQILNVYTLRVVSFSGNPGYDLLLEGFEERVVNLVRSLQCPDLVHTRLEVDNLTNGLEFASLDINAPGTNTCANPSPPFVSVGIRLARATKLTRNGYKRYAGIDESNYTDGVLTSASQNAWQANVADVLATGIGPSSSSAQFVFESVIVGRVPVTGAYDLNRVNEVTSAVVQPNVTTQNTRKFGRGN